MDEKQSQIVSLLSGKDVAIARTLIDSNYSCSVPFGLDLDVISTCPICIFYDWKIGVSLENFALNVFKDGVMFSKWIEPEKMCDFDREVCVVRELIGQAVQVWHLSQVKFCTLGDV